MDICLKRIVYNGKVYCSFYCEQTTSHFRLECINLAECKCPQTYSHLLTIQFEYKLEKTEKISWKKFPGNIFSQESFLKLNCSHHVQYTWKRTEKKTVVSSCFLLVNLLAVCALWSAILNDLPSASCHLFLKSPVFSKVLPVQKLRRLFFSI